MRIIVLAITFALIASCSQDFRQHNSKIKPTDVGRIMIEKELCSETIFEVDCMRHLLNRIED